jgi:hypothetical protein
MDELIYDREQQEVMDLCYLTLNWQRKIAKATSPQTFTQKPKLQPKSSMKIFHLNNLVVKLSLSYFEYILVTCVIGP